LLYKLEMIRTGSFGQGSLVQIPEYNARVKDDYIDSTELLKYHYANSNDERLVDARCQKLPERKRFIRLQQIINQ